MEIYLLRHGEYLQYDSEQKLSPVGEKQIQVVGKFFQKTGTRFDCIISSPKKRAVQTAGIIAEATGYNAQEIVQTPCVKPNTHPDETMEFLQGYADNKSVLIAGHLPSVGEVFACLLAGKTQIHSYFETATVCRIDVDTIPCTESMLRWFLPSSVMSALVS